MESKLAAVDGATRPTFIESYDIFSSVSARNDVIVIVIAILSRVEMRTSHPLFVHFD